MNTSEAATTANVTRSTIRTWCRMGAVAAVKSSGRWNIDPESLAHRIALTAPTKPTPALSADTMVAIGGNRWTRNGMDRVYLNDWHEFAGLAVSRYNTGNISGASLDGEPIANGRAGAILGAIDKVYYDAADGKLHARHYGADSVDIRLLDGRRYTLNLVQAAFDGIKTAIAAL
jgi:hypothetical protein